MKYVDARGHGPGVTGQDGSGCDWVPGRSDPPKRFHGGKSTYQESGIDTRITLQSGVTVQLEGTEY